MGNYTCKISFTGDTAGAGFVIRPPKPVKISGPFTSVNIWHGVITGYGWATGANPWSK